MAKEFAELQSATDEAVKANEAKTLSLANISHEIRTPLHGIDSFAEIGKEHGDKDQLEAHADYFAEILDSSARLMNLLNDVLDLSKLESGMMHYEIGSFDLRRSIDGICHEFPTYSQSKEDSA